MKKIRLGFFETNSSSTHSICIAKNTKLNIPKSVVFEKGEFGWEWDKLDSVYEKASYLYTLLDYIAWSYISNENGDDKREERENKLKEEWMKFIEETLKEYGVEQVEFKKPSENDWYYVDHGTEADEFVRDVLSDKEKLINYLFSPLSFILTGNDNSCDSDNSVKIDVDYEHDEYYKGN